MGMRLVERLYEWRAGWEALLCVLSFFGGYLGLPIFFLLIAFPLYLWRNLAIMLAGLLDEELGAPLSPESGFICTDDYQHRSNHIICGVYYTDRPIDRKEVVGVMEKVVACGKFPELSQKLTRFMSLYFWGYCSQFKVENQVKDCPIKDTMSMQDVQKYQEHLTTKPFDLQHPLWEIVLFPTYKDVTNGGSAFAFRVHHTLADGFAQVSLFTKIHDLSNTNADFKSNKERHESQTHPSPKPQKRNQNNGICGWLEWTLIPFYTLYYYLSDINYNNWIKPPNERSEQRHYSEAQVPLETIKMVANVSKASASEVLVAAVTTAVREQMLAQSQTPPRTMSAVYPQVRPGHSGRLTNHFLLATTLLPTGESNPGERMNRIVRDFREKRKTCWLHSQITNVFGLLQQLTKRSMAVGPICTLAITNFYLTPTPWRLFGANVIRVGYSFEVSKHISFAVMFIGYGESVTVWVKGRNDVVQDTTPILSNILQQFSVMTNLSQQELTCESLKVHDD